MVEAIAAKDRIPFHAAGLLRPPPALPLPAKWPAYLRAVRDPSPLVRAARAAGLALRPPTGPPSMPSWRRTGDGFPLMRIGPRRAWRRAPGLPRPGPRRRRWIRPLGEHLAFALGASQ